MKTNFYKNWDLWASMKKLSKVEIKKITKRLKPYWKEYWKIWNEFLEKSNNLEKKMNNELNLNSELEFFYVDGECVGIEH